MKFVNKPFEPKIQAEMDGVFIDLATGVHHQSASCPQASPQVFKLDKIDFADLKIGQEITMSFRHLCKDKVCKDLEPEYTDLGYRSMRPYIRVMTCAAQVEKQKLSDMYDLELIADKLDFVEDTSSEDAKKNGMNPLFIEEVKAKLKIDKASLLEKLASIETCQFLMEAASHEIVKAPKELNASSLFYQTLESARKMLLAEVQTWTIAKGIPESQNYPLAQELFKRGKFEDYTLVAPTLVYNAFLVPTGEDYDQRNDDFVLPAEDFLVLSEEEKDKYTDEILRLNKLGVGETLADTYNTLLHL